MKKRRAKVGDFLIVVFTLDKGEKRSMDREEITRKLPIPEYIKKEALSQGYKEEDIVLLSNITVFTKGSFFAARSQKLVPIGKDLGEYLIGDRGSSTLVSQVDGSEFHCITPFTREKIFWSRKFYSGPQKVNIEKTTHHQQHVYIILKDKPPVFITIPIGEEKSIEIDKDEQLIRIWRHEE